MGVPGSLPPANPRTGSGAATPSNRPTGACPPACKLVSLKVVRNATQTNVKGAKNWACVKKNTDDVIVEATTVPNTDDCWKKINWSGDTGDAVPGRPNQRKLSRATREMRDEYLRLEPDGKY